MNTKKTMYRFNKLYRIIEIYFFRLVGKVYKSRNKKLQEIVSSNRDFLNSIDEFLSPEIYKSVDYGIPLHIYKEIDRKIDNSITYSDLIVYLLNTFNDQKTINYLEVGVSVMKNFMQINSALKGANLYVYDINPIVPLFSSQFEINNETNKKVFESTNGENKIIYFQGDVLSPRDQKKFGLIGNDNFNFVLSDAMHTAEGVLAEYENIIKQNLSDHFILYFDDLDFDELFETAEYVYKDLSSNRDHLNFYTFWINGWVGQNEKMHKNGIITSFNLEETLKRDNIKLPFFKKH